MNTIEFWDRLCHFYWGSIHDSCIHLNCTFCDYAYVRWFYVILKVELSWSIYSINYFFWSMWRKVCFCAKRAQCMFFLWSAHPGYRYELILLVIRPRSTLCHKGDDINILKKYRNFFVISKNKSFFNIILDWKSI